MSEIIGGADGATSISVSAMNPSIVIPLLVVLGSIIAISLCSALYFSLKRK